MTGSPVVSRVPVVVPVTVEGSGLHICEEDKMAAFVINSAGQQGQPEVRIEGMCVKCGHQEKSFYILPKVSVISDNI